MRTMIVTGGNSGLGFEAARKVAGASGECFDRNTSTARSSGLSRDERNAAGRWAASARFTGLEEEIG